MILSASDEQARFVGQSAQLDGLRSQQLDQLSQSVAIDAFETGSPGHAPRVIRAHLGRNREIRDTKQATANVVGRVLAYVKNRTGHLGGGPKTKL